MQTVAGGRYWVRTSDLFGVNEARYHCANRPTVSSRIAHRLAQGVRDSKNSRFLDVEALRVAFRLVSHTGRLMKGTQLMDAAS